MLIFARPELTTSEEISRWGIIYPPELCLKTMIAPCDLVTIDGVTRAVAAKSRLCKTMEEITKVFERHEEARDMIAPYTFVSNEDGTFKIRYAVVTEAERS